MSGLRPGKSTGLCDLVETPDQLGLSFQDQAAMVRLFVDVIDRIITILGRKTDIIARQSADQQVNPGHFILGNGMLM